jgi:hypothetical protein
LQTLNRVPLFRNFFLREENCRRVKDPLIQTGRLREEGGRGVALGTLAAHDCGASGGALPQDQQPACLQGPCLPARVPSSHQHGFTTVLQVDRAGASGPMRVGRGACAAITRVCRGQSDPFELVSWLLNTLDRKLQRHGKSIVADTFQGRMRVKTKKIPPTEDMQRVAGISIDPNGPEYQGAQLPLHRGGRGGGGAIGLRLLTWCRFASLLQRRPRSSPLCCWASMCRRHPCFRTSSSRRSGLFAFAGHPCSSDGRRQHMRRCCCCRCRSSSF